MKIKFLALSVMLAGVSMFANAQDTTENYYTKKATDNIFFGFGVGGMSVINGGVNTPTLNFNVQPHGQPQARKRFRHRQR